MNHRLKHRLRCFITRTSGRLLILTNIKDVDERPYQGLKNVLIRSFDFSCHPGGGSPKDLLFVCLNLRKPHPLEGLPVKLVNDFLTIEDRYALDRFIYKNFSLSWYRHQNLSEYKGIHLGDILQYDFQKFVTPRLKNTLLLKRIFDESAFDRMLVLDDTNELLSVAQAFAEQKQIPCEGIILKRLPELRSKLSLWISEWLNVMAHKRLYSKLMTEAIFIDAKLHKYMKGCPSEKVFIPMFLQYGLSVRRKASDFFSLHLKATRRDRAHWREVWIRLRQDPVFMKQFQVEGLSFWPWMKGELENIFCHKLPRISCNVDLLNRFFKQKKISQMIFRNDHREFEKTCILSGRKHGVKSMVVQHGILAECNGHNHLWADRMAVWGPASIDWYKKYGNDPRKLTVTGNPNFDHLVSWKPSMTKSELCKKVDLNPSKKIVLYVTQQINKFSSFWTDDLFYVMSEDICDVLKNSSDYELLIKADPYESVLPYQKILNQSGITNGAAVRDFAIHEILPHCDVVVTLDSTVGLEAMFFNKPLVTYNLIGREDRIPFYKYGAAFRVKSKEELYQVLQTGAPLSQNQFVQEYAHDLDGRARHRLAALL